MILKPLKKKKQLAIPAHVAREFAVEHMSEGVKKDRERWQSFMNNCHVDFFNEPGVFALLGKDYEDVKKKAEDIKSKVEDLKNEMNKLTKNLINDVGDDPVSIHYREIFTEEIIWDDPSCLGNKMAFDKEKEQRYIAERPPGYMDKDKKNNDSGDLIIWKSILEQAKEQKRDCIFVTNDQKQDWFLQFNKKSIMPRRELLEEFRHETNGKTLHIINLQQFLELFGSSPVSIRIERLKKN